MSNERTSGAGVPSPRAGGQIPLGIGDDAAVLRFPAAHEVLVTTDFSLEGVHFRRDWHPPESVGHRCLARGLSDIAAMGGEPVAAFLSLALPAKLPQKWVDGFLRGLIELASQYGVKLAGGDTAESRNGVLADIVVLGSAPRGKAVRRSGAKPGDCIYVTGALGASALALQKMYAHPKKKLNPKKYPKHFFPEPRVAVGRYLSAHKMASSMIDLSDGLSTDLHHLCEESGVGAQIDADLVPRAAGTNTEVASLEQVLHGGEDYELLFTVPAKRRVPGSIAGVPVTLIGEVSRSKRVILLQGGVAAVLRPHGWEHFA
jgi:thiamine-monophosphate kinase